MMRDTMQLDRIAQVLSYVNGRTNDVDDDIIPESELYGYLCRIIDRLIEDDAAPDTNNISGLISDMLSSYKERTAGARRRLERACGIIIMTYYATLIRHKANDMYGEIFKN